MVWPGLENHHVAVTLRDGMVAHHVILIGAYRDGDSCQLSAQISFVNEALGIVSTKAPFRASLD